MIIKLDYVSEMPIYVQLRNEIVRGIGNGELAYGEALPTVRALANDVQVNTMTVNKTYALLKQEGFISIDRRHGAKVLPVYDKTKQFRSKVEGELSLLACEAVVKGMKKKEFLAMCEHMLDEIQYES